MVTNISELKTLDDCYEYAIRFSRLTSNQAYRWVNHMTHFEKFHNIYPNRDYAVGYFTGMFHAYGMIDCRDFVSKVLEIASQEQKMNTEDKEES